MASILRCPPPEGEDMSLTPTHLYSDLQAVPKSESLKDTYERVLPYWNEVIVPEIKKGEKLLIAAHGNSIRGLLKHIKDISDDEIVNLEIPTANRLLSS